MFLLDTNVLSELRRRERIAPAVGAWADSVDSQALFISVITLLEIEMGILAVERRDPTQAALLRRWLDDHVMPTFDGRILPIDTAVARECARLHVPDRKAERDALIGATALVHRLVVVTRNIADFEPMKVRVLNPWVPEPRPQP